MKSMEVKRNTFQIHLGIDFYLFFSLSYLMVDPYLVIMVIIDGQ